MAHFLQHVFVDLLGPRKIASASGALYLLLFKDDAMRMGWLYPLKSKGAADVASAPKKSCLTLVTASSASGRTTAPIS